MRTVWLTLGEALGGVFAVAVGMQNSWLQPSHPPLELFPSNTAIRREVNGSLGSTFPSSPAV